jgi:hypothetical protein
MITFINDLRISVLYDEFILYNSYTVKSKNEMYNIIEELKEKFPNYPVSKISTFLLVSEWATHNILYNLGILRVKTRDTNLNVDKKWYINLLYIIIGFFYL